MSRLLRALTLLALATTAAGAQINTRGDTIVAAPVPPAALGPQVAWAKGYHVAEVTPGSGVYWVTEGSHQVLFFTTGRGVVVVDAPPIFGDKIAKAIAEVTREPVTHLIYSHHHADHIAGAWQFPAGIQVIASAATAARLRALQAGSRAAPFGVLVGGKPVPAPTITIARSQRLRIGTRTVQLELLPIAHTAGDLAVLLPRERVLAAVDLVWPGWIPFEALGEAEDVGGYIAAHRRLLALPWDVMVAGHVGRLATPRDVEVNLAYLADVQAAVLKAVPATDYMMAGRKAGFANSFLTVETYFDMIARAAAREVEAKWVGTLGGADVWTYSNCRRMMMWLRIN